MRLGSIVALSILFACATACSEPNPRWECQRYLQCAREAQLTDVPVDVYGPSGSCWRAGDGTCGDQCRVEREHLACAECNVDAHCDGHPGGPRCDDRHCVECTTSADCGLSERCSLNSCEPVESE